MSHIITDGIPFLSPVVEVSLIASETVLEENDNDTMNSTLSINATATVSNGGAIATNFTVDLSTLSSTAGEFLS